MAGPNPIANAANAAGVKAASGAPGGAPLVVQANGPTVTLPKPAVVINGEYARSGSDLMITGTDGDQILVQDYFATDNPPDIETSGGAKLAAGLVSRLAGPLAPGQVAADGGVGRGQPIGNVETATGSVQVTHADGTKEMLAKGAPVYQGDVLQTPQGASVGILFVDSTSLSLGANGRMVLDQLVFDPASQTGKSAFSLVSGSFSFISGQISKTSPDAMVVNTPVATMGIRGTLGVGEFTPTGGLSVAILPEAGTSGQFVGEILISNAAGVQVLNQPNTGITLGSFFNAPTSPVAFTAGTVVGGFGSALSALPATPISPGTHDLIQKTITDVRSDPGAHGLTTPGSGAAATPGEFASQLQQAMNAAIQQGGSVTETQKAAMEVLKTLEQTLADGGDKEKALLAATQTAQKVGLLLGDGKLTSTGDLRLMDKFEIGGGQNDVTGTTVGLNARLLGEPANGTVRLNADGTYSYSARDGFSGTDSFTIEGYDEQGNRILKTITISSRGQGDLDIEKLANFSTAAGGNQAGEPSVDDLANFSTAAGGNRIPTGGQTSGGDTNVSGTIKVAPTYVGSQVNPTVRYDTISGQPLNVQANGVAASDGVRTDPVGTSATVITGTAGNDIIVGGEGIDSYNVAGSPADYTMTVSIDPATGSHTLTLAGNEGTDILVDIERLAFSSGETLYWDQDGTNYIPAAADAAETTTVGVALSDTLPGDPGLDAYDLTYAVADDGQPQHGTVTVNADGTYSYTPNTGFAGTDSFTYTVSDGLGGVSEGTVSINVDDTGPTAQNVTATVGEDGALAGNLVGSDVDPGDSVAFALNAEGGPAHGTVIVNADGSYSYVPNAEMQALGEGQTATDSFTYTVTDSFGETATATADITITGANDAAVLSADAVTVNETDAVLSTGGQLAISDADAGQATFQAQINTAGEHGTFSVGANGVWSYTANAAYNELGVGEQVSDSFTVLSADGTPTTVSVTIAGTNDQPMAVGHSYVMNEDGSLTITPASLLAGSSDVDGDALSVTSLTPVDPNQGSLVANADGSYTFTPAANWNGTVDFTYTVSDGQGGTATATATVDVASVGDAAVMSADAVTLNETDAVLSTGGQLAISDADAGQATFQAQTGTAGTYGTFAVGADGVWSYTANAAYNELGVGEQVSDSFTVLSADGTPTTVSVTIAGTNDQPMAVGHSYVMNEDGSLTITPASLLAGSSDVDGDTLSVVSLTPVDPNQGSLVANPDGSYTFTPADDWNGTVNFTYTVTDGQGGTATATATVDVSAVNDGPTGDAEVLTLAEDTVFTGSLTGSDVEGDALSFTLGTAPANGNLSLAADGTYTYTPNANFNGTDSFTYVVSDGQGGTATATGTITVTPVNDVPTAVAHSYTMNEDGTLTITPAELLAGSGDIDGNALSVVGMTSSNMQGGSLTSNPDGSYTFTPAANWDGTVSFDYTISDGAGGTVSAPATITVNAAGDSAVLSSDTVSLVEANAALATGGQLTIADPDAGQAVFQAQTGTAGSYGTFAVAADGAWTYTMNGAHNELTAGQQVSETFTVLSADGTATSVTVNLTGTNDTPVLSSATTNLTETDAAQTASGTLTISDADAGQSVFQAQTGTAGTYGTFSVAADGTWSYAMNGAHNELTAGQQVSDIFTVLSADGTATSVTVNLTGTNDAPVMSTSVANLIETDAAQVVRGNLTISDPDGQSVFQPQPATVGQYGTFAVGANGAWSYAMSGPHNELTAGQQVSETFTVLSADGTATSVTVNITGTNDAPVLSTATAHLTETDAARTASGTLTIRDADAGEAAFQVQTGTAGTYGTFAVGADGAWTYTMNGAHDELTAGQQVRETFTVLSADGTATSVTVRLTGSNDAPVLSSATTSLTETDAAQTASGTLTISDADAGQSVFQAQTGTAGTYGTFSVAADGTWSYAMSGAHNELTAGQQVSETFTVLSADGTATSVTVNLTGTNDAPLLSTSVANLSETDAALTTGGTLTISDADAGEAVFQAQINTAGEHGTFSVGTNGVWSYTANAAYNELGVGEQVSDSFTVLSADGTPTTVSVTIAGTNDQPMAVGHSYTMNEDGSLTITPASLLAGSSDVDGDALSVVSLTPVDPNQGSLVANADGSYTFTPADDWNGTVNFTYTVTDGQGGTATATATVDVSAVNDGPTGDAEVLTLAEDTVFTGSLTGSDVEGDALSFTLGTAPANGNLSLAADGTYTYTPNANFNGTDSFTYVVSDGQGGTATATGTITVTPVNDVPTAVAHSYVMNEDGTLTITPAELLAGSGDIDGNTLSVVGMTSSNLQGGRLAANPDGTYTFTPAANWNGTVSFDYTISDGAGGTVSAPATIQVDAVADAAVLSSDTVSLVEADAALTTGGQLTIADPDAGEATFQAQTGTAGSYGTFAVGADGAWTYTMNGAHNELTAGQQVSETFTVLSADGTATSVTVRLTGTNDLPVMSTAVASLIEADAALTATGQLTIADADADQSVFQAQSGVAGAYGTFSVAANGTWSYAMNGPHNELAAGEQVSETFAVLSADGSRTSVTVNIAGTNDAPVLTVNTGFAVEEGETLTLTNQMLAATDVDNGDSVTFTLTDGPDHGDLLLNGVALSQDATFTQADIDSGNLVYQADAVSDTGFEWHDETVWQDLSGAPISPHAVDPYNLEVPTGATSVVINLLEVNAGYHNTVGWYEIGADGQIGEAHIIWSNVSDISTPSAPSMPTMDHDISNIVLYLKGDDGEIMKVKIDEFSDSNNDYRDVGDLDLYGFVGDHYADHDLVAFTVKAGYNHTQGFARGEGELFVVDDDYSARNLPVADHCDESWDFAEVEPELLDFSGSPGGSTPTDPTHVTLEGLAPGEKFGLFIINDGDNQYSWLDDVDSSSTLRFNAGGDLQEIGADGQVLHTVNDTGLGTGKGAIFHATGTGFDGVVHATSGIDGVTNDMVIGFEDLTGGGDRDYNDLIISVSYDVENAPAPESDSFSFTAKDESGYSVSADNSAQTVNIDINNTAG